MPRRLGAYNPAWLDQLTTGGEIVWIGAGSVMRSGRVALYFRDDVRIAGPPPSNAKLEVPAGEVHELIRERLASRRRSGSTWSPSWKQARRSFRRRSGIWPGRAR